MQAVQTNAKITGLLDPEYARERAFYSHISKVPESVRHAAVLVLLTLCSQAPFAGSRTPRSPSIGVLPWDCWGRRPSVLSSRRTEDERGRSCGKNPESKTTQFSVSRTMQRVSPYRYPMGPLFFGCTGDILISAEHNIHIIHSSFTGIILL